MQGLSLVQFVAVGLLVLANAFFVAAEFALVSIRETRIEQMLASGVAGARAVLRLQREMDDFLPAVQLGVTFCSLALGWIGEPLAAALLLPLFVWLPYAQLFAHALAVGLGFCCITYFHVLIGELVPKSLALRRAEMLAVSVARPMLFFMMLARPGVRLLRNSAAAILRGFDLPMSERAEVHSPEELKLLATAARRMGLLPKLQESLVHRALELDDVPVREIMTPRQQIFSLPSRTTIEQATAQVLEQMHSRIPVYDEQLGPEHIVGIVYSKDLARLIYFQRPSERAHPTPFGELELRQVMHDAMVVPETKTVLNLICEFQARRRQMALVVDEFGSTVGLVTAEDAIEQLTGEIEDEFDSPTRPVLALSSGALLMDGSVNLRDLETQMQWNLPRTAGIETLAGFLLWQLGHIPEAGESILWEGRKLTVIAMEGRRIARIRVEAVAQEPQSSNE